MNFDFFKIMLFCSNFFEYTISMETRNITINVGETDALEQLGDALSSRYRVKILQLLSQRSYSTQELLEIFKISPSTLSFHLKILSNCNLVKFVKAPSGRGNEKNLSLHAETIFINFEVHESTKKVETIDIPLGSYSSFNVCPPCLVASEDHIINPVDNIVCFNSIEKTKTQLISFTSGTLEYTLINKFYKKDKIVEISFTQELCSECPNYNNNWKSNITFWINGKEIGTFLSEGDYGGRHGTYSPSWWPESSSNYGTLVKVNVDKTGSYINGKKISSVTIDDLNINKQPTITYALGVKEDSKYVGGINIFGEKFGDFQQNITSIITYE